MALRCGIVGLPNVGKSTLFKALTNIQVAIENFPFCTIEPNIGLVPVADPRLQQLADLIKPVKTIPATVEFVDIAGLIAGASQGEGLGNQFLVNIRDVDLIVHVVRCFEDEDIIHVNNKINPRADMETIDTELILADLQSVMRQLEKCERLVKSGDKLAKMKLALLERLYKHLDAGLSARLLAIDSEEEVLLKECQLLTAKSTVYVANVADNDVASTQSKAVTTYAAEQNALALPLCHQLESELSELSATELIEMLTDLGYKERGLDLLVRTVYHHLGLATFFTAGPKEVRAWTIKLGATAPQGAGVIHTDFERSFIRAEVVGFEDYMSGGGESGAKESGKWRLEGKGYILNDGDVVHFRTNC